MKILLSPTERRALRAEAHALSPVVMIGHEGLTPAVIREIDKSLTSHELIKIRALSDDRDARATWHEEICEKLSAAPIQLIGKILVVWRHSPEKAKAEKAAEARKASKPKPPRLTKREEEQRAANKTPATRRRVVRKV
jgi:RNA-binding protein